MKNDKRDNQENSGQAKEPQREKPSHFGRMQSWLGFDFTRPLRRPPNMGMRIVKTGLAVLAVFLFYMVVNRPENGLLLAMIAAIISLQDSMSKSLRMGLGRLIGTVLGGVMGIALVWLVNLAGLAYSSAAIAVINSIGVMVCISLCDWLGVGEGAVISCVVFTAIFLNAAVENPYDYAWNRVLDTAIGIVISVLVNLSIRRPGNKKRRPPDEP